MENIILNKLGLTKRGALNILSNRHLCERIVNEDIIEIKEAVKKYDVSYTRLFKLIKNKNISYISNANLKKGCKKYIFNLELEYIINNQIEYQCSITHAINGVYKIINELSKKILTTKEYHVFDRHNKGESLRYISDQLSISQNGASIIYGRSIKKIRTYFTKLKKYNELSKINQELQYENERLKIVNSLLKNKITKNNESYLIEDWRHTNICDFHISSRLKNVLSSCDIVLIEDLIKFIKQHGLSYFKKFRDVGKNTFEELSDLINQLISVNKTNDTELIEALKN